MIILLGSLQNIITNWDVIFHYLEKKVTMKILKKELVKVIKTTLISLECSFLGTKTYIHRSLIPFMFALAKSFWPSDVVLQIYLCKLYWCIFESFANFFIFCGILTSFRKNIPKTSPLETFKSILKTSQLTTYIKELLIAFKFSLSSFKHVTIFFFKPCWSNKLIRFLTSACLVISIASNKPIIKCLSYQFSFR